MSDKQTPAMIIANPAQLFSFVSNEKNKFPLTAIKGSVANGFELDVTELFPYLMNFQRWLLQFNEYQREREATSKRPSESDGVPPMRPEDHEQVEINKAAGMPDYEASFQSGYTAGHDAGYEKGKRESAGSAVWVKAIKILPPTPGEYHSKKHGKRFVMLFTEADRKMPKEYWDGVEWLDEYNAAAGSGKGEAVTMSQCIAQQILKVRDAIVARDMDLAYHELYKIASPDFDKMSDEVWADIEKAASQPAIEIDLAAAMEEGAECWKMEYDSCRKLLEELVTLKEIKETEGKTEDYNLRQPIAWKMAKKFLEKYQHISW